MSNEQGPDIVKWYTRARKFPQLIGRTPDGTKIWGGPYTVTQAVGAGLILFVGLNTMSLWASFGMIGNFLILGAVTYGSVLLLGRIPVGSRSPLSIAAGLSRAVTSPPTGRLGGRAVRIRRPHVLRHSVVLAISDLPAAQPATEATEEDATELADATVASSTPETPTKRPTGKKPGKKALGLTWTRPKPSAARQQAPSTPEQPAPAPAAPADAPRRPAMTGVQALLANHPTNQPTSRTDSEARR